MKRKIVTALEVPKLIDEQVFTFLVFPGSLGKLIIRFRMKINFH
jgi:hypothetical protein